MCTCLTYDNGDFYFGRNLDLEQSFGEQIVITPRNFLLNFRKEKPLSRHFAMLGTAAAAGTNRGNKSFPLYAEAVNEKGLCMAGLNFPENAYYSRENTCEGIAIASFELIPWILGQCSDAVQAINILNGITITDGSFRADLPPAPLHWMIADRKGCYVIESMREGLKIFENKFGVLTNNPPFEYHSVNINNYLHLSPKPSVSSLLGGGEGGNHAGSGSRPEGEKTNVKIPELKQYSQGMGAIGLPGDASSASRFVRAAFLKWNSVSQKNEKSNVSQVFHILDGVAMVRGTVVTPEGGYDITRYSCCINADKGAFYYKTYEDSCVKCVKFTGNDLESRELILLSTLQNTE